MISLIPAVPRGSSLHARMSLHFDITPSELSDSEDAEKLDTSPFDVDWLDLTFAECQQQLGLCGLPGCRYKKVWRSIGHDLECLKRCNVNDVFCFLTNGEMYLYRTPDLLEQYSHAGITCHHHPIEDGHVPTMADLMKLIEEIKVCLASGKKVVLQCYGGYGRSCAVAACLMMVMDPTLSAEDVDTKLKALRGNKAIQSVKQYNFIREFRVALNQYQEEQKDAIESRSVSR